MTYSRWRKWISPIFSILIAFIEYPLSKTRVFLEKNLFDKYAERTGYSTDEDFKSYLNTTNPLWSSVLDKIKSNNMACYEPTAVGFYIGLKRLEKTFGWELDFEGLYVGY